MCGWWWRICYWLFKFNFMLKIINKKKDRRSIELPRGKKQSSSKWLYRTVAMLFLATVIFVLFFSDFLSITKIEISGLNKLEKTQVQNIIDERSRGKYLGIINKNNLILFQKSETRKILLDNFKRIEDVKIKKIFPDGLKIIIKERILTMLLCSSGECHILNEKGEPYRADNFSSEELEQENLVTLDDLSGAKISLDNNPLEKNYQEFILKLAEYVLDETGIVLKKQYTTPSRMSGDLKVETEEGWRIYFNENVSLEKELLILKTILANKIEKEQQKDLEYVDLRINNKVFYKFKEGTVQMQEAEDIPVPKEKQKQKEQKKDKKKK
jgi:cell division septal protein FtsQ